MSSYSYTKKPDWHNDGSKDRSTSSASLYAAPMGWVAGVAGKSNKVTTSITAASSGATTTVVQTAHGLSVNQYILITGAAPAGLNGYVKVLTTADAATFTYATLGTVANGVASTQGTVYKNVEVVVACSDLYNASTDALVVPTFTAAVTAATGTIGAMVTGNILRCTLTASENMEVQGTPRVQFVVGAGASVRQFVLNTTLTTAASLVFDYTIAATGDTSTAGQVVVAAATNGGYISDILPKNKRQLAAVTFVAPDASTVAIA